MSVIIGTTNKNGSGSSANLTADNGYLVEGSYLSDEISIADYGDSSTGGYNTMYVAADSWYVETIKEAKVEGSYESITIDNIIDVTITNQSDFDISDIEVFNAKRGNIDTSGSDSSDSIFIGVESNSIRWSNMFTIDTGEGDDELTMVDFGGSKWTELDIDMGAGDDVVNIESLGLSCYSNQERHINGGDGIDTLYTNGDSRLDIEGFEVIAGLNSEALIVDGDLLENNGNSKGLVLTGVDIQFADGLEYTVEDIEVSQAAYLNDLNYDFDDFSQVIVTVDGEEYSLLVDDPDYTYVA